MRGITTEAAFEDAIERHILDHGWLTGQPRNYRRDLGLDPVVLFEFIRASQTRAWRSLVGIHGSEAQAQAKFVRRLAAEIDARGTLDVLRRGVEDNGVKVRLAYFKPGHALSPNLMALYDANRLVVTRQAHAMESNPQDSVDLLLLINGLPVATAELKNLTTGQGVEHAKKQYRRDRNPHDLVFSKRAVVHFAVDPDLVFLTTRLEGESTEFLPFNQGSGGPGKPGGKGNPPNSSGYRTGYLWQEVWQRDNWLDLFGRFIHVEKPAKKKGSKAAQRGKIIFPRYHQWDAVLKMANHAATYGPGRNYLPQHSAGSGKSNTIAWLAHRLSTLHTPAGPADLTDHARQIGLGPNERIFHKIVVVTDRVVLDRQLQDTVFQFDHTPGLVERIDKDSKQLAEALAGARAQIIITTLQKFPVIAKAATDLTGKRFAVIVDEAHSSQTGEAARDLKAVLGAPSEAANRLADVVSDDLVTEARWDAAEEFDRALEDAGDPEDALIASVESLRKSAATRGQQSNLSFFAFTATPKHKTLELFGERVEDPGVPGGIRLEPFHLYSMRQAIEEGFILDVLANYVTYKTYFRLANGLGSQDPEVDKGKANAALARFVALHPSNLAQKAEIIVEHFRTVTRYKINGEAKAMVVTRSRLHAVRYKDAIEDYIAEKRYTDLHALVAFSGKVIDEETGAEYTESSMNTTLDGKRIPETETARRFQGDPENGFPIGDYQVLIVAEKYQTGFDEPRLHTMYVDKKLDGVKAVQTLSRLNRTMSGKTDTFVLDFANQADDIQNSFKPFYEQSWTEPTDPNVLFNLRTRILDAGVIDATEMRTLVAALLTTDPKHHETLYAQTDNAVVRYEGIPDADDREDFRTALRDFIRMYAFLGQIVPFTSPDLEELYYYGRILITRLGKGRDDEGGGIDLGSAAVLTHIRTELEAEQNMGLHEGDGAEAVPGVHGGGRGAQHLPEKVRLSSLIEVLNDKFGMNLTESDQVWFDQQVEAAVADQDLREVASANTEENFAFEFDRRFADVIEQRHSLNDDLFRMFFDKPEFQDALTEWARREVYRRIRNELNDGGDGDSH